MKKTKKVIFSINLEILGKFLERVEELSINRSKLITKLIDKWVKDNKNRTSI